MKWNEIAEKQATQYREFLEGYKEAREQLETDKAMLLEMANCTEATAPPQILDKIQREAEGFQREWGMFSQQFKNMRIAHQKEIDAYFLQQQKAKELTNTAEKASDNSRQKDKGR